MQAFSKSNMIDQVISVFISSCLVSWQQNLVNKRESRGLHHGTYCSCYGLFVV